MKKRIFDLAVTIPSVILLMPIFVLIGFFVRGKQRGQVFILDIQHNNGL